MKLTIKNQRMEDIAVTAVIVSSLALRNFTYLLYILQVFYLIVFITKKRLHVHKGYFFGYGGFILVASLSFLWADNMNKVFLSLPSMVQPFILCLIMTAYISSYDKIEKLINDFILSAVVLIGNLFLSTSLTEWRNILYYSASKYVDPSSGDGRLGITVNMHPNAFGTIVIVYIFFSLYRLLVRKEKKYLALLFILITLLLLSKSRSSLLIALMGCLLIVLYMQKSSVRQMAWVGICVTVVLYLGWATINIPVLYNIVGYRMVGLFNMLSGAGNVDASTSTRMNFILIGLELFFKHPILGIGMNNFSVVAYRDYNIWAEVYSHSNIIELLADLGVVGFLLYYIPIGNAIWRLFEEMNYAKKMNADSYMLISFTFVLGVVLLVREIMSISYDKEIMWYIFMFIIVTERIMRYRIYMKGVDYE